MLLASDLGRHEQLVIILHWVKWASTPKYRTALIIHVPSDYDILARILAYGRKLYMKHYLAPCICLFSSTFRLGRWV